MSAIQRLLARLTSFPKAEIVTCSECGAEFENAWKTDSETGISTGDNDPANEGAGDDSDILNMHTPKQRAAATADIAKSILATAKQRDFVGDEPSDIGPQKCIEIVADKQKVENLTAAELLARALNQVAKESHR